MKHTNTGNANYILALTSISIWFLAYVGILNAPTVVLIIAGAIITYNALIITFASIVYWNFRRNLTRKNIILTHQFDDGETYTAHLTPTR